MKPKPPEGHESPGVMAIAELPIDDSATPAEAPGALYVAVHSEFAMAETDYAVLAVKCSAPALQSIQWVRTWCSAHRKDDFAHVVIGENGQPRLAISLQIERRHGAAVAVPVGGRHANGNFFPVDPEWERRPSAAELRRMMQSPLAGIDVLLLERLLPSHNGIANPLVFPASAMSPNVALAADLSDGFDGLMGRISGKRKRKKFRSQARKFDAAGGYRFRRAATDSEVDEALETFYAMKAQRFRKAGISDPFEPIQVRSFLSELFRDELKSEAPRFHLDMLDVGNVTRAITAHSVSGDRITCEFASFAEDDLASISPGDFLFFNNIEQAAEDGYRQYDFGVGDERYKRQWCTIETCHYDTAIALTMRGRLWTTAWKAASATKRRVKNDSFAWTAIKSLRQRLKGHVPGDQGEVE